MTFHDTKDHAGLYRFVPVLKTITIIVVSFLFYKLYFTGITILSYVLGCEQTDATLLTNNSQHCWMLHVASVCTPCRMLLRVVAQSLKPFKRLAPCKRTQPYWPKTPNIVGSCCARLHVALASHGQQ